MTTTARVPAAHAQSTRTESAEDDTTTIPGLAAADTLTRKGGAVALGVTTLIVVVCMVVFVVERFKPDWEKQQKIEDTRRETAVQLSSAVQDLAAVVKDLASNAQAQRENMLMQKAMQDAQGKQLDRMERFLERLDQRSMK